MDEAPRLDDLIELVRTNSPEGDPIEQLRTAAALKSDLDEVTDALLGHFVDQARRAGASWSQIGEALGVSKQAVQQRHTSTESLARRLLASIAPKWLREGPGFLTRFTPRAKSVVVSAQENARRLRHPYIGTEHVILGLFAEPESIGTRVLAGAGITPEAFEAAVLELTPVGDHEVHGHVPFTPRAKEALEHALREAVALGHNYIGTEHVLLGILRVSDGMAAKLLGDLGLGHEQASAAVLRLLLGVPGPTDPK